MKSPLFIGGYLGFAFGIAFSVIQKESWLASIWHGALTAILASVLLPWIERAWRKHSEMLSADSTSNSLLSTSTQSKTPQT
jgi:hypothetical protein